MKSILHPVLSIQNAHVRDAHILFEENGHKYTITTDPETKYTSVTTWNHTHFPQFHADEVIENMMKGKGWKEGHRYWGLTPKQIKAQWDSNKTSVAGSGTNLHYEIECFMNNPTLRTSSYTNYQLYETYMKNMKKKKQDVKDTSLEWQYFLEFLKDTPHLKPYRTEWLIYDDDNKIAGSIDMVYENPDGTLSIYDWKRSKNITRINNFNKFATHPLVCHLPDSNFWHYAMQLNTYKYILERKYNKIVKDLFLVRLHPEAEEKTYELISIPILSTEMEDLFLERKKQLYSETM
jgi:hypothetical protein